MLVQVEIPDSVAKIIKEMLKKEKKSIKEFSEFAILEKFFAANDISNLYPKMNVSREEFMGILNTNQGREPLPWDKSKKRKLSKVK
ncbi:MAG TPA: hypothetical protein PLX69_05515 [Leptospiraceae bacterium]|nr:hypothetical protein [Leptospiraceae bacterium]HRG73996.1 hypothetical protein [Leptospiraceae bacterium]